MEDIDLALEYGNYDKEELDDDILDKLEFKFNDTWADDLQGQLSSQGMESLFGWVDDDVSDYEISDNECEKLGEIK